MKSKPEWVIYHNDYNIGQAVTWHKALDILIKQERLEDVIIKRYGGIVLVQSMLIACNTYRIIKERG